MTTPRSPDAGRTFAVPAALALAILLAGAGCAAPKPVYKLDKGMAPVPYKFTIGYTAGPPGGPPECPNSATSDFANCNPSLPPNDPDPKQPKDCARAKYTHAVEFVAPTGKQFELQFDPFGKSSIPVTGTTGALRFALPANKPDDTSWTFTFRVTAPGCPMVDPQIIVDW